MCLVREDADQFVAIDEAAVLSTNIRVCANCVCSDQGVWWETSQFSLRNQVTSFAQEDNTTYSDSAEESAMTVCRLLYQKIGEPLTVTTYSVVDRRVC